MDRPIFRPRTGGAEPPAHAPGRRPPADHEELFSLQWLERWRAILISLAIFPVLIHYCSYKRHCEHSFNVQGSRGLVTGPGQDAPLVLRQHGAVDIVVVSTWSSGPPRQSRGEY